MRIRSRAGARTRLAITEPRTMAADVRWKTIFTNVRNGSEV
jgi:hypothetical protein